MKGNGKAKDVLRGKITRLKPDTYSATAQAHHIVSPETAYVKGQKVIGTLQKKTLDAEKNGSYDAPEGTLYERVNVNVDTGIPDGYILPSGTKEITENDEYDITEYAKVKVNVPIPDGYIKPNGTKEITEPGKHNVTNYEEVDVQIATEEVPYYDGTVIIEKAESPFGLRRLKENPTPILLDTAPTDGKGYYDANYIEIEPIYAPPSTDDGISAWYYGFTPVYSTDGGTTLKTMMKITAGESMSDNFMYFPTDLSSISGTFEGNIIAVANDTVAEWVLANTKGVSV